MDLSNLKRLSELRMENSATSEIEGLDCLEYLQIPELFDLEKGREFP